MLRLLRETFQRFKRVSFAGFEITRKRNVCFIEGRREEDGSRSLFLVFRFEGSKLHRSGNHRCIVRRIRGLEDGQLSPR